MAKISLYYRFGDTTDNPSTADLERAIGEIFDETDDALSEGDYEEHPNAWLTHGEAAGEKWTVVTLDLYRTGEMRFTKYADQDDDEPEFDLAMDVGREEALRL